MVVNLTSGALNMVDVLEPVGKVTAISHVVVNVVLMKRQRKPTDLTYGQLDIFQVLLLAANTSGRPRSLELRQVLAIFLGSYSGFGNLLGTHASKPAVRGQLCSHGCAILLLVFRYPQARKG